MSELTCDMARLTCSCPSEPKGAPFSKMRLSSTWGFCDGQCGSQKNAFTPRDVYEKHLGELKTMMEKGAPSLGFYHSGGCAGEN